MRNVSKLTKKYQMTLPCEIRKKLGVTNGDRIYFGLEDGRVILRPIGEKFSDYMAGLGKDVWNKLGGGETFLKKERSEWE